MAKLLQIHEKNPQVSLVREAAQIIKAGGIIVMPTDSAYALVCQIGNRKAQTRIRQIRQLSEKHHFALLCRDLSELSTYAKVSNSVFRLLKAHTPGPYTFILPATREVPRMLQHPNRKTIGLRVPEHIIAQAILEANEEPLISSTLIMPEDRLPLIEPEAICDILGSRVDLIVNGGYCGIEPTTVVDCSEEKLPKVIRMGKGDASAFL